MPYRSSDSAQPTALYRLYDGPDRLLYIGITRSPEWRWYKHATHSHWWPEVQRREIVWYDSRPEARQAEIAAIGAEKPMHNKYDRTRAALAAQLRELREEAGLSGNALARQMGIVQSRVWKIENEKLTPAERDIRAWAEATDNSEMTAVLLEMLVLESTSQAFEALRQAASTGADAEAIIRQALADLRETGA